MNFVRENDIIPFFIHCDDVEYGLRCGKPPIIIEGVQDWLTEYYLIRALNDYLNGIRWLKRIDAGKYHRKLLRMKSSRYKNAFFWRVVERRFRWKYRLGNKEKGKQ